MRTFRSLAIRNYRLYFIGQIISFSGTWIQLVAQMWLVLRTTGSGVALGAASVVAASIAVVALGRKRLRAVVRRAAHARG
ncbi:hypothetical protein BH24ACT26_BH24ACT26_04710 [soil metagenome]